MNNRSDGKKKEKPTPRDCVCGKPAAIVKSRGGKMITCPDPINCCGNLRTRWQGHESVAIEEWNNLVAEFLHIRRMKEWRDAKLHNSKETPGSR